jgi:ferritin
MKLKPAIAKSLNEQINIEFTASYHYLAMSAYFEDQSLPGFADFFRKQSAEETEHGMKIYDYVFSREGHVKLEDVSALKQTFQSAEDAIQTALEMEKSVTASIHKIFEQTVSEKDPGTENLMKYFVDEQIEEEETFRDLLDNVRAAGNDRWRLHVLDTELSRKPAHAA